jgi:hypothetical protein
MALCVVLARLAWPDRLIEAVKMFGRLESWISRVFNDVCTYLSSKFKETLQWHPQLQNCNRLLEFGQAISKVGGGGKGRIWGFIDGTFRAFQNPSMSDLQTFMYSSKNKATGMKWQAIVTPDGLISSLIGPWEGKAHDWRMFQESSV